MKVIKQDLLRLDGITRELVGSEHGLDITLLFVDAEPGDGVAPHRHPYPEVFIVQEGQATYVIDGQRLEAAAGDILFTDADEVHSFVNSGTGPLRQVDIHLSPTFSTQWLDEESEWASDR
jgi:quercetin dioxygenase-like cupin family protein